MHLGRNVKIGEITTTVWGSVASPIFLFPRADYQAETNDFNAIHTAPNQQPWTSEVSVVQLRKEAQDPSLPYQRWFQLKSLKNRLRSRDAAPCTCGVKPQMCAKSCISCGDIHTHSIDFPWRQEAYGKCKDEEYCSDNRCVGCPMCVSKL